MRRESHRSLLKTFQRKIFRLTWKYPIFTLQEKCGSFEERYRQQSEELEEVGKKMKETEEQRDMLLELMKVRTGVWMT